MFPNDTSPDSSPESIPPIYWLGVCRGLEAAKTFATCSWEGLSEVLVHYPILILPEFPDAIRALASLVEDANAQKAFAARAINLSLLHDLLRQEDPQLLASLYHSCGIELVQDYRQDRRLNVDRSIALFDEALHGQEGLFAARCRMCRANALLALAELGEEPCANLRRRLTLPGGSERPGGAGRGYMPNESRWPLVKLAELGEEPCANLRLADALLQEAQSGLAGPDAANCQMNRASPSLRLPSWARSHAPISATPTHSSRRQ